MKRNPEKPNVAARTVSPAAPRAKPLSYAEGSFANRTGAVELLPGIQSSSGGLTPCRMFKYLPEVWADSLLTKGNVRIGTYDDYRRSEHGFGIHDEAEGNDELLFYAEHDTVLTSNDHPLMRLINRNSRMQYVATGTHPLIIAKGTTLREARISRHAFLYCVSSECSYDVMREFEGAQCCVEILNPAMFMSILLEHLTEGTGLDYNGMCLPVKYTKGMAWDGNSEPDMPWFLKHPRDSLQSEIRMIMEPIEEHEMPPYFIQEDLRLTELVKLVLPRIA